MRESKVTEAEVLAGGVEVEGVFVRQVPMRKINQLGESWLDEEKEMALFTSLSAEDQDALSEKRWDAIIKEGRRLNFTRFAQWFQRRQDVLADTAKAMAKPSPDASNTSSPKAIASPTS